MRRAAAAAVCTLPLAACELHFEGEVSEELASICEPVVFEETPFTHCTADPARHTVGTDLSPEDSDAPYRSLRVFSYDVLAQDAASVVFAMNGGMFDAEGQPIGYYVEDGLRLTVLNQNEGPGNFHLLPNGVFFGEADGGWRVLSAERFADEVENRPFFATQSGPMLVVDGALHPDIAPDGTSYKIRNAVGVDASGRAHFVISEAPVSFGRLARYYRDVLRVDNALFLDGSVSQIWDPANDRLDTGPEIGPLIVVRNRAESGE
ncbi:phosphodiester glycosidase family protein [Erythrobacter sp. EC-HK427]|uniref:phosphodiester glycosidase family protein n=1 Tax=Erythrobacter sp. EC-HK427 TaxID=2038396 RepID=UPI001254A57C|nr:phosphodiester glycosidase family protein [Erythrobacter sp. EC-HK427]VVT16580.1 conserved hypothetical protein [Erythrobacter sp. EC-HK427]